MLCNRKMRLAKRETNSTLQLCGTCANTYKHPLHLLRFVVDLSYNMLYNELYDKSMSNQKSTTNLRHHDMLSNKSTPRRALRQSKPPPTLYQYFRCVRQVAAPIPKSNQL